MRPRTLKEFAEEIQRASNAVQRTARTQALADAAFERAEFELAQLLSQLEEFNDSAVHRKETKDIRSIGGSNDSHSV